MIHADTEKRIVGWWLLSHVVSTNCDWVRTRHLLHMAWVWFRWRHNEGPKEKSILDIYDFTFKSHQPTSFSPFWFPSWRHHSRPNTVFKNFFPILYPKSFHDLGKVFKNVIRYNVAPTLCDDALLIRTREPFLVYSPLLYQVIPNKALILMIVMFSNALKPSGYKSNPKNSDNLESQGNVNRQGNENGKKCEKLI